MSAVTKQEIVDTLWNYGIVKMAERIEAHGIAPPDGFVLVPIITEATPFNCGINGDPPQVDPAWAPRCKVWCGRKQCAAKDKP